MRRRIVGWRAWLDNQVITSRETSFTCLPDHAIQVVMLYREDGTRHVMCGTDYYWLAAGGCESFDTCYGNGQHPPDDAVVVLEGKEIATADYEAIQAASWDVRTFDG